MANNTNNTNHILVKLSQLEKNQTHLCEKIIMLKKSNHRLLNMTLISLLFSLGTILFVLMLFSYN